MTTATEASVRVSDLAILQVWLPEALRLIAPPEQLRLLRGSYTPVVRIGRDGLSFIAWMNVGLARTHQILSIAAMNCHCNAPDSCVTVTTVASSTTNRPNVVIRSNCVEGLSTLLVHVVHLLGYGAERELRLDDSQLEQTHRARLRRWYSRLLTSPAAPCPQPRPNDDARSLVGIIDQRGLVSQRIPSEDGRPCGWETTHWWSGE